MLVRKKMYKSALHARVFNVQDRRRNEKLTFVDVCHVMCHNGCATRDLAKLVGIMRLFVASKVEEIVAPFVSHFLHCANSSYTESEILLAERYVLKTIDWNLSFPNPMHFLRRISKDYDLKSRTMGKYLLEVGTLEWCLLATPPSLVAAAAIRLSRLVLGNDK